MQAACRVYQHHVGTIGLGTLKGIEGHRGRITSHLLLDDGHSYPLTPDAELLDGSCTEGIGSTETDLLACLLELPSQLTDGRGLAHAVHAYHQYHVGLMVARQIPVVVILGIVLCQQGGYLFLQDIVQL